MSTATATRTVTGYRVQCARCNVTTFAPRAEAHAYWNDPATSSADYVKLPCRECGRHLCAQSVTGRQGKRKCGSWCTEGHGLTCTCECGGRNHGAAYPPGTLFFLH